MKLRQVLFILFFIFSVTANAQQFNGGVMLGLVGSQVAGDLYSGYNKAGISAGGWVSLAISPKSTLQMELAYLQKGSRENPDQEKDRFDTYIMRLGYIEMPFLYRIKYNTLIEFEGGLGLNFLIHSRETFNGFELTDRSFTGNNLCMILGLSVNVNEHLKINIRTNNSLFSIRKDRVSGDVWRLWDHGQFSDALVLSAYYRL